MVTVSGSTRIIFRSSQNPCILSMAEYSQITAPDFKGFVASLCGYPYQWHHYNLSVNALATWGDVAVSAGKKTRETDVDDSQSDLSFPITNFRMCH